MVCVTNKIGRNFSMPPVVAKLFDELVAGLGEKRKWVVVTAALLEYGAEWQKVIQRVTECLAQADFQPGDDGFKALIRQAVEASSQGESLTVDQGELPPVQKLTGEEIRRSLQARERSHSEKPKSSAGR